MTRSNVLVIVLLMLSYVAIAQETSLESLSLNQVPAEYNAGRSYIVLAKNNIPIDTLLETYNSIGRKVGGLDSYYIVSDIEVAFIDQSLYRHMIKTEEGVWKGVDRFMLPYCNQLQGIIKPSDRCCYRWRLVGLDKLEKSYTKYCDDEPVWKTADFQALRSKSRMWIPGTKEFEKKRESLSKERGGGR